MVAGMLVPFVFFAVVVVVVVAVVFAAELALLAAAFACLCARCILSNSDRADDNSCSKVLESMRSFSSARRSRTID